MTRLLTILASLMVGCCGVAVEAPTIQIERGPLPPWYAGWTQHGPRHITISESFYRCGEVMRGLLAHELIHAAGFHGHLEGEGDDVCIMWPIVHALPPRPCPAELEFLRGVRRSFPVLLLAEDLREDAEVVTEYLNRWADFPVFVLLPP